jgi:hypothetical protein
LHFAREHPDGALLDDIGDALGVTGEAVRVTLIRALAKCRAAGIDLRR